MSTQCAADGCNSLIGDDKLMCADHWRLVPYSERSAVNTNLRAIREAHGLQNLKRATRRYRDAVSSAVEAVRKAGPLA